MQLSGVFLVFLLYAATEHGNQGDTVDIVGYARSLGAQAVRPESREELEEALRRSAEGTWVIDIPIDPAIKIMNPRDETLNFGTKD